MGPTCCLPLKGGMKFVALVDLLFSTLAFVVSVGGFVYFERNRQEVLDIFDDPPPELGAFLNLRRLGSTILRVFLSFNAIYWLQKIVLGLILFVATIKENKFLIRMWIIYTLGLLCLSVCFFLAAIILGVAEPYSIPFYIGAFIIREYSMWLVSAFLKRLQFGKRVENEDDDNDKVTYKL